MGPLDIILILIIAAVFALALRRTLKKKGSCSCGAGCENCSGACASCGMHGSCAQHKNSGEAPDQTPKT